ncbi:MAG: hypothetical protein IH819_06985 [Bacteroidetes bacterium]|nr:hypothetical protein [Bacteroidota bacterium]
MTDLDAQQELAFIKKVMTDSRKILIDDGKATIFWGILISFGLLITYLSIAQRWESSLSWFWPALIGFGWIYTIVTEIRHERKRKVKTFAGKIVGAVWISFGISATILGFVGTVSGAYHGVIISPLISVLLGTAFLVSGLLYGKSWVSYLSVGWWGGAIMMFFMQNLETLLIMISMLILFQVIPGIILYREFKKERTVTE